MFTKATFFAALVAGASAVSPAAYGGESYNSTSTTAVYSPEEPKTYPSSTTEVDAHEPTYPAEYPSSKTEYEPTHPVEYPSTTSSVPYSPHEPSTYESSSTTCTESTSTKEHPYQTTDAHPTKFTKTSDDYTTVIYTGTKVITVDGHVTTTESVYSTYCPKSDVSKYTKPAETTPYSPEKPTHSAPVYKDVKSSSKSVPYHPAQTYPAHGPLTTGVYSKKPVPSGYSTSEKVVDKVLTYTLGHGASTTVITTTVKSTSTIFLTKTVYAGKSTATGEASKPAESKGYKTYKATSTITNTVTVHPKPTGKTENSPNGGKPDYECKPVTVTVTAKETVTVTAPAATKSVVSPKKSSSAAPYYPSKGNGYPVSSGVAKPTGFATYYTKPTAPVYKSKTDEYKPEHSSTYESHPKPTHSAPVYPVHSSSTEKHAEYPTTSSVPYSPHSTSTEEKPTYPATYPVEDKPTYSTSVVYVTPVPSTPASPEKPAGYGAKPAGY